MAAAFISLIHVNDLHRRLARYRELRVRLEAARKEALFVQTWGALERIVALHDASTIAAVIVGVFAIFHGHAHGTELPQAASPIAYSLGFVIATGLLHLAGIALGLLVRWPAGRWAVRAGGGLISLAGMLFLSRALA